MMEKRNFILLVSTLLLIPVWRLFHWLLPNESVNWFAFHPLEQKPFWYVFYTSYYLTLIIFAVVIRDLSKTYRRLKVLATFLVGFSCLRLVIYWLFRGSLMLDVLIGSVLIYSLIILARWRK